MSVEKLDIEFDYERILKEFKTLEIEKYLIENERQMAIQCRPDLSDPDAKLSDSCGSLIYDWDDYYPEKDYENSGPKRKEIIRKETEFDMLCDLFKDTYIGEVVSTLKDEYKVTRGRFMMLSMKTCLTYHFDSSPRLHIPLITDDNCFMIIDDKVCRIPYPGTYKVDTTKKHTALNASKILRTHLVFVLPKPPPDKSKPLPWENVIPF